MDRGRPAGSRRTRPRPGCRRARPRAARRRGGSRRVAGRSRRDPRCRRRGLQPWQRVRRALRGSRPAPRRPTRRGRPGRWRTWTAPACSRWSSGSGSPASGPRPPCSPGRRTVTLSSRPLAGSCAATRRVRDHRSGRGAARRRSRRPRVAGGGVRPPRRPVPGPAHAEAPPGYPVTASNWARVDELTVRGVRGLRAQRPTNGDQAGGDVEAKGPGEWPPVRPSPRPRCARRTPACAGLHGHRRHPPAAQSSSSTSTGLVCG